MRSSEDVRLVAALLARGSSLSDVARETGLPRSTIRNWHSGRSRAMEFTGEACARCGRRCLPIPPPSGRAYAYLLGQYLGDGDIYEHRRSVFRLVVFGDSAYPAIADEVAAAMAAVAPRAKVGRHLRGPARTCLATSAYSKSWPCLIPQHGPGHKHLRPIVLTPWQADITRAHPDALVRGLIHSDGCRTLNRVPSGGRMREYARYQFSNRSDDIRAIFCQHLDLLGIDWRRMNRWTISVARRASVARLDELVGPKR